MSVVTRSARRRWATVVAAVVALAAVPAVTAAVADHAGRDAPASSPRELIARALESEDVGYSGLAESRGSLGLPDLPRLETVAEQLGGTTRSRVWWRGPGASRVDVLTATGEQGIYAAGTTTFLWDYERATLTEVLGAPPLRLPRPDDLVPPQAARRLLAGVGASDTVTELPPTRVAGIRAAGVRVVPGDRRSTIARLDLWLDPADALPLRLDVVDAAGVTALRTTFTDLDRARPAQATVRPPSAPGAERDLMTAPDLVSRIPEFGGVDLPGSLAGLPSGASVVSGTSTYGSGLTRFAALPLPGRLITRAIDAVRTSGGRDLELPGGEARLVTAGAITLVALRRDGARHGYLVAGAVTPEVVTEAARELLDLPPPGAGG